MRIILEMPAEIHFWSSVCCTALRVQVFYIVLSGRFALTTEAGARSTAVQNALLAATQCLGRGSYVCYYCCFRLPALIQFQI